MMEISIMICYITLQDNFHYIMLSFRYDFH